MTITPLTRRVPSEWLPGVEILSERERKVADLLCAGLTKINIAKQLGISENAARHAARTAYGKLGVSNQHQLLALVIEALMPVHGETNE